MLKAYCQTTNFISPVMGCGSINTQSHMPLMKRVKTVALTAFLELTTKESQMK